MQRRTISGTRRVHIAKRHHVRKPFLLPRIETAAPREAARISEGAEDHVPERQVGEVIGVMTILMMQPMRFRSLHDQAQPARRPDIPVIKEFRQCAKEGAKLRGANATAEQRKNDRAAQKRIQGDLDRMFIKTRDDLETTRGVVQLMTEPPEKMRIMSQTMPPIIDKRQHEVSDQGRNAVGEMSAEMPKGILREVTAPGLADQESERELNGVDKDDALPPTADAR